MQDLNDLFYFSVVVDHQGFAPAARALNLPKSSLSRRVARLEERLGARLIERSTRRFAVTEIGQAFYRHAQAAVTEAQAAEDVALQLAGEPRGVVRVSVPVTVSQGIMAELLPGFLAQYPLVKVQLTVTNRRIDLIEEGVDVAFRVRMALDTDQALIVRVLGHERSLLVASPAFLEAHPAIREPQDLFGLPTISNIEQSGRQTWKLEKDGQSVGVDHDPRLRAGDFQVLVRAALAGVGVAQLPEIVCAQAIESGALRPVLPDWTAATGIFHLVFTGRRGQLPAVSAFIDYVVANIHGVSPRVCDLSPEG